MKVVDYRAPFRWLALGWADLWRAPWPCLMQGVAVTAVSLGIAYGIYATKAAFWTLSLTFGFVFLAPVIALGPYEAGRLLERGESPTLRRITLVRSAPRGEFAYLGLALLLIYGAWIQIAQIIYGLSSWQVHRTLSDMAAFAFSTSEGNTMLLAGIVVGTGLAYVVFVLVVVSAPMLLDPEADIFSATVTSVRAVLTNPGPTLLWAATIAILLLVTAASGLVLMIIVFPWLGLSSWHAFRALVAAPAAAPASDDAASGEVHKPAVPGSSR